MASCIIQLIDIFKKMINVIEDNMDTWNIALLRWWDFFFFNPSSPTRDWTCTPCIESTEY